MLPLLRIPQHEAHLLARKVETVMRQQQEPAQKQARDEEKPRPDQFSPAAEASHGFGEGENRDNGDQRPLDPVCQIAERLHLLRCVPRGDTSLHGHQRTSKVNVAHFDS